MKALPSTHWHVMQTLLGCAPGRDTNKRFLMRGFVEVAVFNAEMRVWSEEDDQALHKLAKYLNQPEPSP